MPNSAHTLLNTDIGSRHDKAVSQWREYLSADDNYTGPKPEDSLLSALADLLGRVLNTAQVINALVALGLDNALAAQLKALLSQEVQERMNASPVAPEAIAWATLLDTLRALRHPEPDFVLLNQLASSCRKPSAFPHRVWDGYFYLARMVAHQTRSQESAEISLIAPGVQVARLWQAVSEQQLRDPNDALWELLKHETQARLETRFAKHEYQMAALWQSVDRKNDLPERKFSALQKNVEPVLCARDMGWVQQRKVLSFAAGAPRSSQSVGGSLKFFGLPGLLWTMGVDGELRRRDDIKTIKEQLTRHGYQSIQAMSTDNSPILPTRAQCIEQVRRVVAQKGSSSSRFAASPVSDIPTVIGTDVLILNDRAAQSSWNDEDRAHTVTVSDVPELRASQWQEGGFFDHTNGKSIAVVWGLEGDDGQVHEWIWGSCDEWACNDEGVTTFELWPNVNDGHPLRDERKTLYVCTAELLDMSRLGHFVPGLYVIYVQVCML